MKRTMKKAVVGVIAAGMVLSIGATSAFAVGPGSGRNFTDQNGDGICDYGGSTCRYTDADNDGICDSCGMEAHCGIAQNGYGRNFVDADGDGVCDHYAVSQGAGQGRRARGGCRR